MVDAGMEHDAVLAAFVEEYGGQHVLAAPIDKGFNRLLWFFPYFLGAAGAIGIAIAAVKWSRRSEEASGDTAAVPQNDAMAQRLDDELRDLD
jgi:cytochrome c-type biogenesis protein CcmH/NrfF